MEKEREKGIGVKEERRGTSKPAKEQKQAGRRASKEIKRESEETKQGRWKERI